MRWLVILAGIVIAVLGIIWILQGLNILAGSPMTGEPFWAGAGIVAATIGLGVIAFGLRPRAPSA